jgi:Rrf2 family nitric oxide-sensitive transcriptional repressor
MQLTRYTDYSLRVLIYLSLHKDKNVTIDEINDFYHISRNHLMKVVHNLSVKGFIITTRGKHGGMRLARDPDQINIGDVVRRMEPHFNIVECQTDDNELCRVAPICTLKSVLDDALEQFLSHLDQHTLADATMANASIDSLNKLAVRLQRTSPN